MKQHASSLKTRSAAAGALCLSLFWPWVADAVDPDSIRAPLVAKLKVLSGEGATDCGTFPPYRRDVLRCAEAAMKSGQRFWFVQEVEGVDTIVARGIASDGKTVWVQRSWEMFRSRRVEKPYFTEVEKCIQPKIQLGQNPRFSCGGPN